MTRLQYVRSVSHGYYHCQYIRIVRLSVFIKSFNFNFYLKHLLALLIIHVQILGKDYSVKFHCFENILEISMKNIGTDWKLKTLSWQRQAMIVEVTAIVIDQRMAENGAITYSGSTFKEIS